VRIGKYDVLYELGAGGMGVVFKAFDSHAGRTVAIKMIGGRGDIVASLRPARRGARPPGLDPDRRIALVREAREVSKLHHPNIIEVLDYGQHYGLLYIVMEYLEGRSLDRIIASRAAIPLGAKLSIIIQLCDALAYAHSQGLIHRDVKPPNTFVLTDGRVKVLDFGLAARSPALPALRGVVGTPHYMAPELFCGARYDARVDIWAAGVTLYQLLTGTLPFAGSYGASLLQSIMNNPVAPLDLSIPHFSELNTILGRALAKNPGQRYASADAFSLDLRGLEIPRASWDDQALQVDNKSVADLRTVSAAPPDQDGGSHFQARRDHTLQLGNEPAANLSTVSEGRRDQDDRLHFHIGLPDTSEAVSIKSEQVNAAKAKARLSSNPALFLFPLLWAAALLSRTQLRSVKVVLPLVVASFLLYPVGMIVLYPVGITVGRATLAPLGYIRMHGDLVPLQEERAGPWIEIPITACALVAVISAIWGGVFAALTFAEKLSETPRCRSCRSWMKRKSNWTRHVRNDAAASLGYADCIAALRSGLWVDAAKLLFVHGNEYAPLYAKTVVSPPMRLQLTFFDCGLCHHQAARLTTQDRASFSWRTRFEYLEAYRAPSTLPVAKRSPAARGWRAVFVVFRAAVSAIPSIRMDPRVLTFFAYLALITLFVFALYYSNRLKSSRHKHQGQVSRPVARPGRPQ
jgi:serine/threonine protein kinase